MRLLDIGYELCQPLEDLHSLGSKNVQMTYMYYKIMRGLKIHSKYKVDQLILMK